MKRISKTSAILTSGVLVALLPLTARAIELIPEPCRRAGVAATTEECGLPQLLQVLINVGFLLMGIAGSIALALFVYGGFVWLTSGGSSERIAKGKSIIVQTVIALAIIFGAATGVRFLQGALGFQETKFVQECKDVGAGYACKNLTAAEQYNNALGSGACLAGYCGDKDGSKPFEACCSSEAAPGATPASGPAPAP